MVKNILKKLFPIWICLSVACTGCGQETAPAAAEDVELLDPVGVSYNYDIAARRNLYDVKVYAGVVSPYVEEYEIGHSGILEGFDAFPGQTVRKGDKLLHGDTEDIDKKIEEMEKSIRQMEEDYQEYVTETNEALAEPREERNRCKSILDNLEKTKPEQFIPVEPGEGEEQEGDCDTPELQENPAYTAWMQDYKYFDGQYRNVGLSVDIKEEEIRQRTELYELDHAYNLSQLEHLRTERNQSILYADMDGCVSSVNLRLLNHIDTWMGSRTPLVAVVDETRVEICSAFVSRAAINRAEDVYAVVDGKRYEVEYHPIEQEEYKRLEEKNGEGNVFSTFTVLNDGGELQMGSYAIIVVLNASRRDVVTVPRDSVSKDDNGSYVYRIEDNESTYTSVKTGMRDGLYVEILSGVEEGDKVLTEQKPVTGSKWGELVRGQVSNKFSGRGYARYPAGQAIGNPVKYGTCYYVEGLVSTSQPVKKGDVLARIRVVPDQAELDRNEIRLQRERERLAELKAMGEEQNKKAIAAKEKVIGELEKLVAEMKADFAVTEIKAPVDGIISDSTAYEKESLISRRGTLYYIADQNLRYVILDDEKGQLAYGNRVTVNYNDTSTLTNYKVPGTVVSLNYMAASRVLHSVDYWGNGWEKQAVVLLDPEYAEDLPDEVLFREGGWWIPLGVETTCRSMDNVVLVPKKAVTDVQGSTYVKVRTEDGGIQYVSFIAGGSDSANYWVVEGLTEGMEICLE